MGLTIYKRGKTFHADLLRGGVHAVRGSLGTRNLDAALRLQHRLELALSEGPGSALWPELRLMIPHPTFARFANFIGVKQKSLLKWKEFREVFESHMNQKLRMGELSDRTVERYRKTLNEFELFLSERQVEMLQHIDKSLIDDFKVWRFSRIDPEQDLTGNPRCSWTLQLYTTRLPSRSRKN